MYKESVHSQKISNGLQYIKYRCMIYANLEGYPVYQESPTFLKQRATSCIPINVKDY